MAIKQEFPNEMSWEADGKTVTGTKGTWKHKKIFMSEPYFSEKLKKLATEKEQMFAKSDDMTYNIIQGGAGYDREKYDQGRTLERKSKIATGERKVKENNLPLPSDVRYSKGGAAEGERGMQNISREHKNNKDYVRTVGKSYNDPFVKESKIDFIGETVHSAEELAGLLQRYRDPRYETLRVIFLKNHKIVRANGLSNQLEGMVYPPFDITSYIEKEKSLADADSFFLVHNHPSGDPTPSLDDIASTLIIGKIDGFLSHLVLDILYFQKSAKKGRY